MKNIVPPLKTQPSPSETVFYYSQEKTMCSFIEQLVSELAGMDADEQMEVLGSLING